MAVESKRHSAKEIQAWLVENIATNLDIPLSEIDSQAPFTRLGIDSMMAVSISGDLEDWLNRRLSSRLLIEYPTIEKLAHFLAKNDKKER